MTNILKFEIDEKEIDSNLDINDERIFSFTADFTEYQKGEIVLSTGTTYASITFVQVSTLNTLRIETDQEINIKLNGGTQVFTVNKNMIWNGDFTQLDINNASGYDATIKYEYYS
jgi:hypothetical protein